MKNISSRLILGLGIGLWSLLALHIFFVYSQSLAVKQNVKWWTFLQWIIWSINYLPYISDRREDRYIQNFLFDGCSNSYVSWTDILYADKLCKISTNDNKTFNVLINTWAWSDWKNVSIDDIFFTYNNIIKNNSLWLAWEEFSQLEITKSWSWLNIVFPNNSYDNRIFFTNKILPAHILSWKNLEYYKDTFWKNIVTTSCAKIKQSWDINSFVIDLSKCQNYNINNYQLKIFSSFDALKKYETSNKNIDLYFWDERLNDFIERKFLLNKFVWIFYNTKALWPEFRQSFTKIWLSWFFDDLSAQQFVKDQFIFNWIRPDYKNLTWLVDNYLARKKIVSVQKTTPKSSSSSVSSILSWVNTLSKTWDSVNIPTSGQAYIESYHWADSENYVTLWNQGWTISDFSKNYYVPRIDGQFTLTTILPKRYEYITISLNGWKWYSPKSFDWKKSNYNISSSYKNYNSWLSKYVINAYNANWSYDVYIAKIYFSTPPEVAIASSSSIISSAVSSTSSINSTNPISSSASTISSISWTLTTWTTITWSSLSWAVLSWSSSISSLASSGNFSSSIISSSSSSEKPTPKVVVLYLNEWVDKYVWEKLKSRVFELGLLGKFDFRSYDNPLDLQDTISSNDYDIVIRSINLWQKRDISPLISSSDPNINISQYNNWFLVTAIQQYFLANNQNIKNSQKEIIDEIYWKDMPFVLLGKTFEKFYIKQDWNLNQNFVKTYWSWDIVKIYDLALLKKNIQETYIIQKPIYDYWKIWNWKNFQNFINNATK